MGLLDPQFSRKDKTRAQAALLIPGSLFLFLIGMGTGSAIFYVLAVLGLFASGAFIYQDVKKRAEKKRVAAEEAEIRAHQLRQARGQQ
ncbi:hypothetical protein ABW16_18140 [Mycolicibacter heraklionensis]|uniref:Uncharacterized protein n=1 Tax=Mycolicibacter heraklionensis TaxID=512402 RepID=A0A9X7WGB9_9MYCO|nr:hypothetical protein [Mycolicibacter heraklionensis]KLO26948.1 hypothetical protein ABW16_18140 [Mycolicibacter heraklionensis]QZA07337.1 hypothetical protein K3U94_20705 [Mycolicibacter heraklionensis]